MKETRRALLCNYCGHQFTKQEAKLGGKYQLTCPNCKDSHHTEIKYFDTYPEVRPRAEYEASLKKETEEAERKKKEAEEEERRANQPWWGM